MKKKIILIISSLFLSIAVLFSFVFSGQTLKSAVTTKSTDEFLFSLTQDDGVNLGNDTYQVELRSKKGNSVHVNCVGADYASGGSVGSTSHSDMYIYNTDPFRGFENIDMVFNCDAHLMIAFSYNPINLTDLFNSKYQDLFVLADIENDCVSLRSSNIPYLSNYRYFIGFAYNLWDEEISITGMDISTECADEPESVPVGVNYGNLSQDQIEYLENATNDCGNISSSVGNGAFTTWEYLGDYCFFSQVAPHNGGSTFIETLVGDGFTTEVDSDHYSAEGATKIRYHKNTDNIYMCFCSGRYFDMATLSYEQDQKDKVNVWSPYSARYTNLLNPIIDSIAEGKDYELIHTSKSSYPGLRNAMVASIATGQYPGLTMGYPNDFVMYHGSKILRSLDEYVDASMLSDFYANYLVNDYLYDTDGVARLYGLPFSKSTEVLWYNGVFVDYCDYLYPGQDLKNIPETWSEWFDVSNSNSKVYTYMSVFNQLVSAQSKLWGVLDEYGNASSFELSINDIDGKICFFDYTNIYPQETKLMTWDSLDNAFITLIRQWDAQYTRLPESEYSKAPKKRVGSVLFANNENLPKTLDMLKSFNTLNKNGVFGTPNDFSSSFSSEAMIQGKTVFSIISTAGVSLNTAENVSCRYAPIPYADASRKFVISQGADICMTTNEKAEQNFEVMSELTSNPIYQAQWAINTGYFPATKSAAQSTQYQAFLNDTSRDNPIQVGFRDVAKINFNTYTNASYGWTMYAEEAFIGSSVVRTFVGTLLNRIFNNVSDVDNDSKYYSELRDALSDPSLSENSNLFIDLADALH